MSQRDDKQFLALYRACRYEDQLNFYEARHKEFKAATTQATILNIGLLCLITLTAGVASWTSIPSLRLTCLLIAAISTILSSALTGYSALYGFEQQAKLYQDTINNLKRIRIREPQLDFNDASVQQINQYVQEIENVLLIEQGQWGQLARKLKPSEA